MDLSTAVKTCFSKYLDIEGRAQRPEFWWFALFSFIASAVAELFDTMTGFPIVGLIVGLALLAPSITVAIRRLHDVDKSGWWYLLVLVPILGWLVLLYFFVIQGTKGDNQFGADLPS